MFICLSELSVGRKTDDAKKGRDNYRRVPKWGRMDVLKGKSWPYIGGETDQLSLMGK